MAVMLLMACGAAHVCSGYALGKDPNYLEEAHALFPWLVETRRELHASPEILFDLANTSAIVRRHLDEAGISYK